MIGLPEFRPGITPDEAGSRTSAMQTGVTPCRPHYSTKPRPAAPPARRLTPDACPLGLTLVVIVVVVIDLVIIVGVDVAAAPAAALVVVLVVIVVVDGRNRPRRVHPQWDQYRVPDGFVQRGWSEVRRIEWSRPHTHGSLL
ncbi:MAG TPA: hypothetical protein VIH36_16525 [Casimicrobiaceae bacterium]|jgi:hypothetical protein